MKIVAIARVRNEADIIEPFVRHHCTLVDKMLVQDDGSTDDTLEMLHTLRGEGLPIVVLSGESLTYDQSAAMTRLLHIAAERFGADWIAPVDADEFIEPPEGATLRDLLQGRNGVAFLGWDNFLWAPPAAGETGMNPVLRLRRRLRRPDLGKVIVPVAFAGRDAWLLQGSHVLWRGRAAVPGATLADAHLCHFPVRNPSQYATKIAVSYLKYRALADWDQRTAFHYIAPFQTLVAGGLDALERRMGEDSRSYASRQDGGSSDAATHEEHECPLQYRGGPLTIGVRPTSTLADVLSFACAFADDIATHTGRDAAAAEAIRRERALGEAAVAQMAEDLEIVQRRFARLELELIAAREAAFVHASPGAVPAETAARFWSLLRSRTTATSEALRVIRASPFFEPEWYLRTYPDVKADGIDPALHYLQRGAAEGRAPGPHFSTTHYVAANPDVAASHLNPLVHFERYGRAEGRLPPHPHEDTGLVSGEPAPIGAPALPGHPTVIGRWHDARSAHRVFGAEGWSVDEAEGTWIVAELSALHVPVFDRPAVVVVDFDGVWPMRYTGDIGIEVGAAQGTSEVATAANRVTRMSLCCPVPPDAPLAYGRLLTVSIRIPNGMAAAEVGLADDARTLRLFVRRVRVRA